MSLGQMQAPDNACFSCHIGTALLLLERHPSILVVGDPNPGTPGQPGRAGTISPTLLHSALGPCPAGIGGQRGEDLIFKCPCPLGQLGASQFLGGVVVYWCGGAPLLLASFQGPPFPTDWLLTPTAHRLQMAAPACDPPHSDFLSSLHS